MNNGNFIKNKGIKSLQNIENINQSFKYNVGDKVIIDNNVMKRLSEWDKKQINNGYAPFFDRFLNKELTIKEIIPKLKEGKVDYSTVMFEEVLEDPEFSFIFQNFNTSDFNS